MAAAVLGASTFGSVSVMAAESTEAMAVPADEAGMVVDGDAVAADGDAIPSDFIQGTFKPSDTTVQAQDSYEYPFLGLNMKLPEELLKQIKAQTIAMITNEVWNDNADAIKYAYISWSEMTEEQKEAEVDKLGTAYDDWCNSLAKIGVLGIYDEESQKLINMRNQGAMMGDPTIREGFVQSSIAKGLEAAGSNANGAMAGYMGMGMGMQGAGGFMSAASNTNMQQMNQQAQYQQQMNQQQPQYNQQYGQQPQYQQQMPPQGQYGQQPNQQYGQPQGVQQPSGDAWTCSCGTVNTGNFCPNCGGRRPAPATWTCSCGTVNTGKFCPNCGNPRP